MRKYAALAVVAAALLAACDDGSDEVEAVPSDSSAAAAATGPGSTAPAASSPSTEPLGEAPASIDGLAFTAAELQVDGAARPAADGTTFTVRFEGGSVIVDAGCNQARGAYQLEGATLVVDQLASTRKGCAEPLAEQDVLMSELLTGAPTVTLAGDELTLTGDNLVFVGTEA